MTRMQWDDLRLALAVAESGSAAGAGRRLGVAHTTVTRRLATLEKDAGALFFERVGARLVPTDAGRAVLAAAADFAKRIDDLARQRRDEAPELAGDVTITSAELIASTIATILPRLREQHPRIHLRLRVTPHELDLAKREADIAVRVNPSPESNLVGKRVAFTELAVFASHELAERDDAPWVCFDDEIAAAAQSEWEAANVPSERVVLRTNSRATFIEAVRAGVGIGVLPKAVGDAEPNLIRRGEAIEALRGAVWVLVHPSVANVARIRAVASFLTKTIPGMPA